MNYWILKTEPGEYSFADLQRDRKTIWDGVTNAAALKNLRAMAVGDQVLVYHTGTERQAVGLAKVTRAAFPSPSADDPKIVAVELAAVQALPRPVTLAAIKADPGFAELALVRQGRLSVVPVPASLWSRLLAMGGL